MKAQYKALIVDTMLKEVRSKTLIFIFVATTVAIILGQMVLNMMINQKGMDFSFTGIDALSISFRILNSISFIIAAIFGVSVFRSDFQNNIIYQYLSFPISRTEYFFIRVIGTWLLVLAYYTYSYILTAIMFSFAFKKFVFTPAHFLSFLVLCLYLLMVIFISIFFSLLMNKIGALFVTFVSAITASIAFNTYATIPYSDYFVDMGPLKGLGLIFYYLFPRISFLDTVSSKLLVSGTPFTLVLWEQILHLIVITGAYIFLANYFVKRKNF